MPGSNAVELSIDLPDGSCKVVRPAGATGHLADVLRLHGVPINTRCGGRGRCESCTVHVVRGKALDLLTSEVIDPGNSAASVRACQTRLPESGACHVQIPAHSYLKYEPQIVTDYRVNITCGHDPLYQVLTDERAFGVAVDIGTTTVALLLVDLSNGKVVGRGAMFNQQINLGDDVITRIQLCADKVMIRRQQEAVADETILPLLEQALHQASAELSQVKCFAIAGNTTMMHLLAGVDPTALGFAPFTATFLEHTIIPATQVFRCGGIDAEIHLLPSAGAYVGADLTAGVVASGMLYDEGPSLLVDVGTNGEIILKHEGKFLGCATAAGPAFEGAGLSSGMRAGEGTIAYVSMHVQDGALSVEIETIGDQGVHAGIHHGTPVGICGSAYVDFLAEARRVGFLSPTGAFNPAIDAQGRVFVYDAHHGEALRLVYGLGKQPIAVTRRDIASLLQAKAAVAAGILTLLEMANLQASDIKTVYLAGGFGTKMRVANAIACGLLPGFAVNQVQPVGNTSLAGAYLALLDRSLLSEMQSVGRSMRVVELNLDPAFEDRYVEQLSLA